MMTAVMALLLMAGTSAFAQENKSVAPPRERPTTEQLARKATDRMTAQLKLTEKQAEKAYEAMLERLQADEALREQARAAKMKEAEAMKFLVPYLCRSHIHRRCRQLMSRRSSITSSCVY